MEIIVEVGNEQLNSSIYDELRIFSEIIDSIENKFPTKILQIIVPEDFDKKINDLEGRTDYSSKHGIGNTAVRAMAKNVSFGDGRIIIISPWLFVVDIFDYIVRSFILFHEVAHCLNANRFPDISNKSFMVKTYLGILYNMYDEYFSDRLAYQIAEGMIKQQSNCWENFTKGTIEGYLSTANDNQYYDQIREEIAKFRIHGNVDLFLNKTNESVSVVSTTTVHGFARYYYIKDSIPGYAIPQSNFVNDRTIKLMNYFASVFDENGVDLSDGIDFIVEYFKNFGVEFVDKPEGGYVYINDI